MEIATPENVLTATHVTLDVAGHIPAGIRDLSKEIGLACGGGKKPIRHRRRPLAQEHSIGWNAAGSDRAADL